MKPKIYIFDPRIDYRNTYCLNLLVYTNADLQLFDDLDLLYEAMWKEEFDGAFVHIPKDDAGLPEDVLFNLHAPLKKKSKKPIIIAQGVSKSDYEEVVAFEDNVPVKDMVQAFAKKIGITAKYMAGLNVGQYFSIPTRFLIPGWQVVRPVFFYDNEKQLRPLLNVSEFFTVELLEMLGPNTEILVKAEFRLELINSFTSNIKEKMEGTILLEERISITNTAYEMISSTMQIMELPETSLQLAKTSIQSMEKIVNGNKTLMDLFDMILEDKGSMRFKHSLVSMYIGRHMLTKIPWATKQQEDSWSYLCFFHDIMLTKDEWIFYDHELDLKDKPLDKKETTIIINHARLAAKLISQAKDVPPGVDTLIKQHHGTKMGDCLGKLSMSISPLSILFVVVENFTHFLITEPEKSKNLEDCSEFIDSLFKKYPFPTYKKVIPYLKSLPFKH